MDASREEAASSLEFFVSLFGCRVYWSGGVYDSLDDWRNGTKAGNFPWTYQIILDRMVSGETAPNLDKFLDRLDEGLLQVSSFGFRTTDATHHGIYSHTEFQKRLPGLVDLPYPLTQKSFDAFLQSRARLLHLPTDVEVAVLKPENLHTIYPRLNIERSLAFFVDLFGFQVTFTVYSLSLLDWKQASATESYGDEYENALLRFIDCGLDNPELSFLDRLDAAVLQPSCLEVDTPGDGPTHVITSKTQAVEMFPWFPFLPYPLDEATFAQAARLYCMPVSIDQEPDVHTKKLVKYRRCAQLYPSQYFTKITAPMKLVAPARFDQDQEKELAMARRLALLPHSRWMQFVTEYRSAREQIRSNQ
jgi:hypothetical protein